MESNIEDFRLGDFNPFKYEAYLNRVNKEFLEGREKISEIDLPRYCNAVKKSLGLALYHGAIWGIAASAGIFGGLSYLVQNSN